MHQNLVRPLTAALALGLAGLVMLQKGALCLRYLANLLSVECVDGGLADRG